MLTVPEKLPVRGYYYHYKHQSDGPVNNYAYEVMGVGFHTEENCPSQDRVMVIYRPLYPEAPVYQVGRNFDIRPLEMFMEDGPEKGIPRFVKIDDLSVSSQLNEIRRQMYGSEGH